MSKLLLAIISIISFNFAQAQSFKVVKIQGKKAIVEVSDPTMISLNQSYDVGGGSSYSSAKGSFKRDNAIAMAASISSFGSPSVTTISLDGTYLWNLKAYEFGPSFGMTSISPGNSNQTRFGGVGFYNFNENKVGVETVLSAQGGLQIVSGSGYSATQIDLGGNYRWFLLSGDHCFSMSALYRMIQTSGTSSSGFLLTAGISTYF